MGMRESSPVVRVVVRPGTDPRRAAAIARWVRWLLPAALLVVSGASPGAPFPPLEDVITLDADDLDTGPLAIASAVERALARR
jgi:hypothetical protein